MKTLYIGDVNRITQPMTSGGVNVSTETVTFTVRSSKSFTGTAIGTADNAMPWDATNSYYAANWTQSESALLTENKHYWLHIKSVSHGQRLIECVAKYREET